MFGKERKPKSKARKIIDWVVTGVFATLLVGVVVVQIINKTSNGQFTLGPQYQRVLTDSMKPVYKVNDIIAIEKIKPQDLLAGVKNGKTMDVSFKWNLLLDKAALISDRDKNVSSMTHRVFEATYYEEPQADLDTGLVYHYTFKAHGINTKSEWCKSSTGEYGDCTYQTQTFHEYSIIGKVTRKSYIMTFITSMWGLLVFLLVPCMYLIITSTLDIFRALKDDEAPAEGTNGDGSSGDGPKNNSPLDGLSDKEKEKLKKQMLDEMLGKKKK